MKLYKYSKVLRRQPVFTVAWQKAVADWPGQGPGKADAGPATGMTIGQRQCRHKGPPSVGGLGGRRPQREGEDSRYEDREVFIG
jgi:hypothetical protein